jgi:hypothetical protein
VRSHLDTQPKSEQAAQDGLDLCHCFINQRYLVPWVVLDVYAANRAVGNERRKPFERKKKVTESRVE